MQAYIPARIVGTLCHTIISEERHYLQSSAKQVSFSAGTGHYKSKVKNPVLAVNLPRRFVVPNYNCLKLVKFQFSKRTVRKRQANILLCSFQIYA